MKQGADYIQLYKKTRHSVQENSFPRTSIVPKFFGRVETSFISIQRENLLITSKNKPRK